MIERAKPWQRHLAALVLILSGFTAAPAALAQGGVERNILLRQDLDVPGREAVLAEVRIAPGGREGRHSHPGAVLAYVVEGRLTLEVAGAPTRALGPGESVVIEPGIVHEGINRGPTPLRIVATFVVEKDKPLTTPSP